MCRTSLHTDLPVSAPTPGHETLVELPIPIPPGRMPAVRRGRRKLWEIPHKYHCPVIGTCLEVGELRRLAIKARYDKADSLGDYDIHVGFVGTCAEKNSLSMVTHKALEQKYAAAVRRFAGARDADALLNLWRAALAAGEVPGALWAIMTHARAEDEVLSRAYEDVHMLSHQVGAGQRVDLERLASARAELQTLRLREDEAVRRNARRLEERDRRIQILEARLRAADGLTERVRTLEGQLAAARSGQELTHLKQTVTHLRGRLETLTERHHQARAQSMEWQERAVAAERRQAELEAELREHSAECLALEGLLARELTRACGDCGLGGDCAGCPDLAGRRILCVGGRDTLTGHYRALVTRMNGDFERHDGGVEDNRQRLETMLAAADAVVCPADCVSHDAYQRTKRFCKRHGKPCVLLRGSGISAFARAMEAVANGALPPDLPQGGAGSLLGGTPVPPERLSS